MKHSLASHTKAFAACLHHERAWTLSLIAPVIVVVALTGATPVFPPAGVVLLFAIPVSLLACYLSWNVLKWFYRSSLTKEGRDSYGHNGFDFD